MSEFDEILRLIVAAAAGIAVGFNREWRRKPLGMRTLALVALGSVLAPLGPAFPRFHLRRPAAARPCRAGILEGVLAGIGVIGAGAVMRDHSGETVEGLTTAATVWVTAALGIACVLADWALVAAGVILTLGWIEARLLEKAR